MKIISISARSKAPIPRAIQATIDKSKPKLRVKHSQVGRYVLQSTRGEFVITRFKKPLTYRPRMAAVLFARTEMEALAGDNSLLESVIGNGAYQDLESESARASNMLEAGWWLFTRLKDTNRVIKTSLGRTVGSRVLSAIIDNGGKVPKEDAVEKPARRSRKPKEVVEDKPAKRSRRRTKPKEVVEDKPAKRSRRNTKPKETVTKKPKVETVTYNSYILVDKVWGELGYRYSGPIQPDAILKHITPETYSSSPYGRIIPTGRSRDDTQAIIVFIQQKTGRSFIAQSIGQYTGKLFKTSRQDTDLDKYNKYPQVPYSEFTKLLLKAGGKSQSNKEARDLHDKQNYEAAERIDIMKLMQDIHFDGKQREILVQWTSGGSSWETAVAVDAKNGKVAIQGSRNRRHWIPAIYIKETR